MDLNLERCSDKTLVNKPQGLFCMPTWRERSFTAHNPTALPCFRGKARKLCEQASGQGVLFGWHRTHASTVASMVTNRLGSFAYRQTLFPNKLVSINLQKIHPRRQAGAGERRLARPRALSSAKLCKRSCISSSSVVKSLSYPPKITMIIHVHCTVVIDLRANRVDDH